MLGTFDALFYCWPMSSTSKKTNSNEHGVDSFNNSGESMRSSSYPITPPITINSEKPQINGSKKSCSLNMSKASLPPSLPPIQSMPSFADLCSIAPSDQT